ncbi:MAG TPA: pantetheine-phosphate adenylyltransferase [Anaerolineales bacterium]|nr:pantetheine-phosphate adenylyltransferase [Anaerolineales bacterium]
MVRAMFPGTFDPIHYGHIDIVKRASRLFDEVLVAVYDKPIKSLLFSPEERIGLVQTAFASDPKVKVLGYSGLTVKAARKLDVNVIIRGLRVFSDFEFEFRMALANHRLESDVETMAFITNEEHTFISSTTVREIAMLEGDVSSMVPEHVKRALNDKIRSMVDRQDTINSLRD